MPTEKKKVTPKKKRKVWQIKPVTRVHSEKGYKRQNEKDKEKKIIDDNE